MPREHNRGQRISDLVQRELSLIIQKEMRDPRVGMVTINDVKVSRDLSYANVYVTFMGLEDDAVTQGLDTLNHASGYLRSQLSASLNTRTTPKLRFFYDETVVSGREISNLIDQALKKDEQGSN
jgi:ribosome-binding factor A